MYIKTILRGFIVIGVVLFLFQCASSAKIDNISKGSYKESVEQRIGSPVEYIQNESNDKVLCLNKGENENQSKAKVVLAVWDLEKSQIIFEKTMKEGSVKWHDNDHLEIFPVLGMVQRDKEINDYVQIINVTTNQIMTKADFLKSKDL